MANRISLRQRTFLLFAGFAASSCLVGILSVLFGHYRYSEIDPQTGYLVAGVLSVFGLLAVTAAFWLLFDEKIAKPIDRIAARVRTSAHADVDPDIDLEEARFLGDLAPAVQAITGQLSDITGEAEDRIAQETARLAAERAHLALLLTEIPVAIVMVSPSHQIILYDGQAADIMGQVHVPRLSASVFDYFEEADLRPAYEKLVEKRTEIEVEARGTQGNLTFKLRLKKLGQASGYMLLIDAAKARIAPEAARPLIYDFDLSEHETEQALEHTPLKELKFVVFDTETTGLMPNKDDIVQIGAVRVVNGKIVPGEVMDQLVDPGRAIPAASSKVHGITDDMVAGAPDPQEAVTKLHGFARDAVIVAHNAPFDMSFLHRYGRLCGLEWDHPILDTVLLSAVLFGTNEKHTLDAVCERLNVEIPAEVRHTGLGDAIATAEVLCKMLPVLSSKGYSTFGKVVEQTRKHGRLLKDLN